LLTPFSLPGESRDPFISFPHTGNVDPGFRRGAVEKMRWNGSLAAALLAEIRHGRQIVTASAAAGSEPFWEALGLVRDRRGGWTHSLTP
jgi:hypothetical protein